MSDEARWLDGNALAGMLGEIFGAEMTTVPRRCQSCGTRSKVGAHRAYRGAGAVLRCPACGDVALRIATLPDRHIVQMNGTWTLEIPSSP
jgi:predicted RNA-binding Zn-ribbon protein involved in translation (DUF1610 family)